MQKETGIDSVVLQVEGDGLRAAEKVAKVLGAKLEVIKSFPVQPTTEQRREWRLITRRRFPKTAVFVALLHHQRGQSIPVVRYGNGKGLELHFNGLQAVEKERYELTDHATQRRAFLQELLSCWPDYFRVLKLDYCIDLIGKEWHTYTNTRLHRKLCKKQGAAEFKRTTIYYQPPKQTYAKVTAYDKRKKNRLAYDLTRVEVSHMRQFWHNFGPYPGGEIIEEATAKAEAFFSRRKRSKLYVKNTSGKSA